MAGVHVPTVEPSGGDDDRSQEREERERGETGPTNGRRSVVKRSLVFMFCILRGR